MAKFSKNGRFLYSCRDDSTARVWDLKDMANMTAPNVLFLQAMVFIKLRYYVQS